VTGRKNKVWTGATGALFTMMVCSTLLAAGVDESTKISDIFGAKSGYVHPYVSASVVSSDNINSTHTDKTSDIMTVLSPGIWLAVPASRNQLLSLATSSYTPGGLDLSRDKVDYFQRYQFYLLYGANIEKYSEYEQNDSMEQKLEGIFQYNFRGGLTFEFLAQGKQTRDPDYLTESTNQDNFISGLTGLSVSYELSDMLRLRLDYTGFRVDYDTDTNSFKDRADNSYAGYLFFVLSPKTELFLEYEAITVGYDRSTISDSSQTQIVGGVKWQVTEKSMAKLRLGQATKTFDRTGLDPVTATTLELTGNHSFTQKSSINVMAGSKLRESSLATADYVVNQVVSVGYQQFVTTRLAGKISLVQATDDYMTNTTTSRSDTVLMTTINAEYTFNDWFLGELGVSSIQTDSTLDTIDSERNDIFVRASAAF